MTLNSFAMKRICILGFLNAIVFFTLGQPAEATFASSVSGVDRMSLVKNSIDIPAWHEKSFWPLYEKYLDQDQEVSSMSYRSLHDLSRTDKTTTDQEAFENGKKLIAYRYDEFALRKQYFQEIGGALNGVIALQFVQTEALIDMIESSRIYEESAWKKFRFYSNTIPNEQVKLAKHNMIKAALKLTAEEAEKFWRVYNQFEEECDVLLGSDYSVFGLYGGEASDFTPALAKRLGYNLLDITEREMKLKEKYFMAMNDAVGPSLASRFLAWEDYYSLISKMTAWAENP